MAERVAFEAVTGLEGLQTVDTYVFFDIVVVPLDVKLQLVPGAETALAVGKGTHVHYHISEQPAKSMAALANASTDITAFLGVLLSYWTLPSTLSPRLATIIHPTYPTVASESPVFDFYPCTEKLALAVITAERLYRRVGTCPSDW